MTTCPSPIPLRPKRKRSSSLSTHPTRLHTIDESKHDDVEMYMESRVDVDDGSVSPSSSLSPSSPLTSSSPRRVTSPTKRTHLASPRRHTKTLTLTGSTPGASPPITATSHVIPPHEISLSPPVTGNDVDVLPTATPVLITSVSASAASSSSSVPKSAFRPTSAASSTSTPTLSPLLSPPHTLLAEIRHLALIDGMCLRSDIAQYFARFAAPLAPYGIMRRMKWMGESDDVEDMSPPSILPSTSHHLTPTPFHSHNYHHRIQHQIFTQITTSSRSRISHDRSGMRQMNGSLRTTVIDLTTSTSTPTTTTTPATTTDTTTSSLPVSTSLPVDASMTPATTSPQPILISPTPLMDTSLSAASTPSFSLPIPTPTTTSNVATTTMSATTTVSPSVTATATPATNVAATASAPASASASTPASASGSSSSSSSTSATSNSTSSSSSSSQSSSARFRSYSFPHSLIVIPEMSDDVTYYESKYNHDTTHHNTLSFYRYQPESTSALQGGSHRAYYNQHHQQQQQQQHQQLIAKKIKVMKKQKDGITSGLNATSSVDPSTSLSTPPPATAPFTSSSSSSSTRPRSTFVNPARSTQSVLSFLCDLQHELVTIQSIITSYNIPDHKLAKAILKWHQQWKYGHHYHTQIRKYAYRRYAKENKQKQCEEKKEGDGMTSTSSTSSSSSATSSATATSSSTPVSGASLLTSPFTIPPARFDCSLLFSSSSRPHQHQRHHSRDIYPSSYTPSSTISNGGMQWNMYDTPIVRPHATRPISPTSISCDVSMSTSQSSSSSTASSPITTTAPPMSRLELCILRLLWFIHVRSLLHGVTQPFMLHIMLDAIMKKQHTMSSFFAVLMKFERSLMERLIFPHLRADNLYEIQRLSYGCDPSIFQQLQWKGCQALHVAAGYNAYRTLSWLLDTCHIDINLRSFLDDATPLIIACEMGAILTTRILLMRGCHTLAVDRAGLTALHRAAIYGHVALIPLLIQYMNKYVDTEMASGVASACISLQPRPTHHHDDDGQPSLKRHRPDIDLTQDECISIPDIVCASGLTALHYAILKKNIGCVKALVRMGADINKKMHNDQGLHPALLAVRERSLEIFEFLLDHPSMDRNACTEMDLLALQQSENVTITIGPVQHITEMMCDTTTSPPPLITPSTITPASAALSSPPSSSSSSLPPVTIPGRSSPHPAPFHMRSSSPLPASASNLISPLALQAPSHMMSWSHLLNTSIPIHSAALPPIPIRMNASSDTLPSLSTRVPLQRAHTFSFGAGAALVSRSTTSSSSSSSSSQYHMRPASPIPTPIRRPRPMEMSVTFNIPRSLTPLQDGDTDMSMDLSLQIDGTQMQSFTLPIPHIISSSSSSSSHVHTGTR